MVWEKQCQQMLPEKGAENTLSHLTWHDGGGSRPLGRLLTVLHLLCGWKTMYMISQGCPKKLPRKEIDRERESERERKREREREREKEREREREIDKRERERERE
jgi:hypothetical protein